MKARKASSRAAKKAADPIVATAAELIVECGLSDPWVSASLKSQGVSNANRRKAIIRRAHELIESEDQPESPSVRRARLRAAIASAYEKEDRARIERLERDLADLVEPPVHTPADRSPDELERSILSAMAARRSGRMTSRQFGDWLKGISTATNLIYAEAASKGKADEEEERDARDLCALSLEELARRIRP